MEPQDIKKATKEQLVDRYLEIGYQTEELEAERQEIKNELLAQLKGDGEKIGRFSVTRVKQKRYDFSKITLEQARDLGATKEQIDNNVLKKLVEKNVDLPAPVAISIIEYPLIRNLE